MAKNDRFGAEGVAGAGWRPLLCAPFLLFPYALRALGRRAVGRLGAGLGVFLRLLGFRRKIVAENLRLALGGELSGKEIEVLIKRIYQSTGITFLEIARNFALSRRQARAELIIGGADRLRLEELRRAGGGAIFISAHIANWELLAMGVAAHGFPVAVVVKRMSSPLSQALIERQRVRTGLEVIYAGGTIAKMKIALAKGMFIGFMVDQNITGKKGIRANFFNVPAASIRSLAALVKDTGVPVIPVCAVRQPDGRHRLLLLPALPYLSADDLPAGSEERMLREEWLNTQQYQSAIERMVRACPEQWLWIHRRWKASRAPLSFADAHRENKSER